MTAVDFFGAASMSLIQNVPDSSVPPLPRPPGIQAVLDEEHLRLLKMGYYIAGGITAVIFSFFIFHLIMFLVLGLNPHAFPEPPLTNGQHYPPPPPGLFLGFAFGIAGLILVGWIFAALQIYAARSISLRRNLLFIMIIAGIECIFIPWGTVIGVMTFLVLNRPGVRNLFVQT